MPIDFPNSPTNGDLYSAGGKNWQYNGSAWVLLGVSVTVTLEDDSVTTAKIAAGAVTVAKIADNAVTSGKLAATAAIQPTIVNAKGDLIVGTADDTVARQGVGATNGQLLVVDSTTATGLDYRLVRNYRPASGTVIRPASNQGPATPAQSRVTFFPIEIASCTIHTMWCTNWTTVAGATIRMGIYNSDSSGFPGTLLIDAGTVDASTTTGYKSIAVNVTLPTGRFWIAGVSQGGTPQVQIQTNTWHYSMGFQRTFPTTEPAYFSSLQGTNPQPLYQDNVTGALPATASAAYSNSVTSGHLIGLQIA